MNNQTNLDEVKFSLEVAQATRQPLFIHGSMGIGKSTVVKDFCRETAESRKLNFLEWTEMSEEEKINFTKDEQVRKGAYLFMDMRAAQLQPSDVKGMPNVLHTKGEFLLWRTSLEFTALVMKKTQGCVFFDELNLADGCTQKSLYQIILDKVISDRKISKGVFIVAAGNRTKDGAKVTPMATPLVDRFDHITMVTPTVKEWLSYSNKSGIIVPEVAAFLQANPDHLMVEPVQLKKLGDDQSFPTPRSWTGVCKKFLDFPKATDWQKELMARNGVGEGEAVTLAKFMKMSNALDIEEILKDPSLLEKIKSQRDMIFAYISKLEYIVKETPEHIQDVINVLPHMDIEFSVLLLRGIKDISFDLLKKACAKPENRWLLEKYPKFWN